MYVLDIYLRHMGQSLLWQDQLSEAYTNEFMTQNTAVSGQLNTPELPISETSSTTSVYISLLKQNITTKGIVIKLNFYQTIKIRSLLNKKFAQNYAALSLKPVKLS